MKEAAQRQHWGWGKKNSGNQWGSGQKASRGRGQHPGARNPQGAHVRAGNMSMLCLHLFAMNL